ncbi:MAG: biotin--[acetyl-CoA-carboxylase] ligase [Bacillota bacterium]|jgi:BirA family biotin operon repressor/biotin-[acetyl-CoA-carboxylase] ligase
MRDKILKILRHSPQEISGELLSRQLQISRAAIAKHIKILRQTGYIIEASPNIGYRFVSAPDKLLPAEVKHYLADNSPWQIYWHEEVDSTNNKLAQLAEENTPGFTALFAESQTAGKGRLGRKWYSPQQGGLWFSVLWQPQLPPRWAQFFTLMASVAINEALHKLGYDSTIKWPNDLLLNNKKIAGILAEMKADIDTIHWIIIGIGINCQIDLPAKLQNSATGLQLTMPRAQIAAEILSSLEKYYQLLCTEGFSPIRRQWLQNNNCLGKKITATTINGSYTGKALDMDENGYLVMELADGSTRKIVTGDIILAD